MANLGAIAGRHMAVRIVTIWVDKDQNYRVLKNFAEYFGICESLPDGMHRVNSEIEGGDVFAEIRPNGH